ncbi:MAG: response regulator transcription factor [Anaerolineae bacterium]|nr:MAG: response regulator transcription factor [Anaerolineae bacterium]
MNNQLEILVVDDEASVIEVIGLYLRREGFSVSSARNGTEALEKLQNSVPALVILDVMLPEVDGLEILRRLRAREEGEIPVILLTARGQEVDRIYGLELGADDYVVKPFSPAELVARVKAVLRRAGADGVKGKADQQIEFDDLTIDPLTREVQVLSHDVELTATEFNLLYFLAGHPRQVFSRDALLEKVWGYSEYVDPSTVTVHIRRLREKIEKKPSEPSKLVTVWGVGYKFDPGERS